MTTVEKENEYPLWKIAISKILEEFGNKGYNISFKHELLKEWMSIKIPDTIPKNKKQVVELKKQLDKLNLDYLFGIEKIKYELLTDYNLCLVSLVGIGYKILHPSDQIRDGVDHYIDKANKNLLKGGKILANVDDSVLSVEDKSLHISKMNRVAFLKSAFRKRKLLNDGKNHHVYNIDVGNNNEFIAKLKFNKE